MDIVKIANFGDKFYKTYDLNDFDVVFLGCLPKEVWEAIKTHQNYLDECEKRNNYYPLVEIKNLNVDCDQEVPKELLFDYITWEDTKVDLLESDFDERMEAYEAHGYLGPWKFIGTATFYHDSLDDIDYIEFVEDEDK